MKPHVIIISADYDGCFEAYASKPASEELYTDDFKEAIENYIDVLKINDDDPVELYVGSNRQDRWGDNGSAFETLENLCQEKGWKFNRLLLADTDNGLPSGTVMDDIKDINGYRVKRMSVICRKHLLLQKQLNDVKKNHSNKDITFVFFDDDPKDNIFSYVEEKLTTPQHITTHLVKANYVKGIVYLHKKLHSQKDDEQNIEHNDLTLNLLTGLSFYSVFTWAMMGHFTNNFNTDIYNNIGFWLAIITALVCFIAVSNISIICMIRREEESPSQKKALFFDIASLLLAVAGSVIFALTLMSFSIPAVLAPVFFIASISCMFISNAIRVFAPDRDDNKKVSNIKKALKLLSPVCIGIGAGVFLYEGLSSHAPVALSQLETQIMLGTALFGILIMIINTLDDYFDQGKRYISKLAFPIK